MSPDRLPRHPWSRFLWSGTRGTCEASDLAPLGMPWHGDIEGIEGFVVLYDRGIERLFSVVDFEATKDGTVARWKLSSPLPAPALEIVVSND